MSHAIQEKPTNCETKAADVLDKFLTGKLQCLSTEYLGAFATTMISKRLSIQRVAALSDTVWV